MLASGRTDGHLSSLEEMVITLLQATHEDEACVPQCLGEREQLWKSGVAVGTLCR